MKEYSHYYKKVPEGVEYIDVYRVLEMFDVTNPSIAHAVKKLLVAGGRGHKDLDKDVNEAIVSLNRWIEMRGEDRNIKTQDCTLTVTSPKNLTGPSGPSYFGNN